VINTTDILKDRAKMILTDGRDHDAAAIYWANNMLKTIVDVLISEGFTLREISLGAVPRSQATFAKARPGL
jgi:hypothetical protein